MKQLFERFDYSSAPYLWSHRERSEGGSGFQGYYHWHQGCEMLYVHEGAGHVFVDRHSYDIRGGMLFYFQPFQLHNVRVQLEEESSQYVRTVFHFDPVALDPYIRPYAEHHRLYVSLWKGRLPVQAFDLRDRSAYVEGLIDAAELDYRQRSAKASTVETSALYLLQLLACIRADRGVDREHIALRRPLRYSEAIMQWLELHYAEAFDLFKRMIGMTPRRYREGAWT